ncbi:galactose-3-O-sulfotransferase 2-like [Lepisosteus oculatus]|uniref:Galactose-3-O-sulfotransferase 4 n=1 Tax=Lepisosteus oculatus TaxID=7918 RepID=W5N5W9_LEPOC|nr:PREDICTED: galactose-3-O-sulfotransferase 4-like [Lepisosteus oculatus]
MRIHCLTMRQLGHQGKVVIFIFAIWFAKQLRDLIFSKSWEPISAPCRPHTHVMFLKTHKTASSTVLNILCRFGEERGLRFALPLGYQFGYPLPFKAKMVKGNNESNRTQEFSIMGHHMRFNKSEVEKVMPPDTFYFSILRDPALLAESSYTYYKAVAPAFKQVQNLSEFIDDPWHHYDPRLRNNHYARNLLWFDFGLPHDANFTAELARAGEAEVRRSFQLVLLAEHFDQSMVLLQHALCWPLDAVVSFRLNARQQRAGSSAQPVLSEEQRQKLREWNALDWHLYRAFNQTFWAQVERFGRERMDREVGALRSRREELAQLCLQDNGEMIQARHIKDQAIQPFQSGLDPILGYNLSPGLDNATRDICLKMVRPELQYKDMLDAKQYGSRKQQYQRSSSTQPSPKHTKRIKETRSLGRR